MSSNSLFTLTDLATEVALNYGDQSDITIAKAYKWINRALMRISEMGDWSWLKVYDATFNTVNGTEAYTLADGVKKIDSVFVFNNVRRRLQMIEDRMFRQHFLNPTTVTGTPQFYRNYGRSSASGSEGRRRIALYPVPSSVLAIYYDYTKEISLFSSIHESGGASSTVTVSQLTGMPQHMVDALIEMATAIGMRELDDSNYDAAMSEAMLRWDRLLQEDLHEIEDSIRMRSFEDSTGQVADPVLPPQYSG